MRGDSAEQGFDEGIVVTEPRTRVGRRDAEPGEHGEDCGGLEGGALVAVQHRFAAGGVHAFGPCATPSEVGLARSLA